MLQRKRGRRENVDAEWGRTGGAGRDDSRLTARGFAGGLGCAPCGMLATLTAEGPGSVEGEERERGEVGDRRLRHVLVGSRSAASRRRVLDLGSS